MGFFTAVKGKIFPLLQYFIIFFFFNQMLVKLQKAGKVPEVLWSYLINAACLPPQKCRIWNKEEVAARISPLGLPKGSLAFCVFLPSSDVAPLQFALSISFNWGRSNGMSHLQDLHLQHWTHGQFARHLNVSSIVFWPQSTVFVYKTQNRYVLSLAYYHEGNNASCLFLKTSFLKETKLKQFCLSVHPTPPPTKLLNYLANFNFT